MVASLGWQQLLRFTIVMHVFSWRDVESWLLCVLCVVIHCVFCAIVFALCVTQGSDILMVNF